MKVSLKYIGAFLLLCFSQFGFAQSYPACLTNDSDTDSDGYGWENNTTCVVDTNPNGPAFFTNLETGLRVNLIRAYWDSQVDFNKDVVCAVFSYDGSGYQRIDASITGYQFTPVSAMPPFAGTVSVTHSFNSRSVNYPWSVDNGVYNGPGELGQTQWMEIIDYGIGQSAVRLWFLDETYSQCSSINLNDFFQPSGVRPDTGECIDTDGDGWGWNGVASCRT